MGGVWYWVRDCTRLMVKKNHILHEVWVRGKNYVKVTFKKKFKIKTD
jgi:hypothetical protein